jgi:hypothetical protein
MTMTFFANLSIEGGHRLANSLGAFSEAQARFPVRTDGAGATPDPVEGETLLARLDTPGNSLLELYLGGISAVQGFGWACGPAREMTAVPTSSCSTSTVSRPCRWLPSCSPPQRLPCRTRRRSRRCLSMRRRRLRRPDR